MNRQQLGDQVLGILERTRDAAPIMTWPIPSTGKRLPVVELGTAWN